ncbi:MAG TPA: BLUF domain-containing protein [Polaromonas sp.]|uniref:BLUF domain-containing protein n=1 Tax=Polaromonas sp. TaxID=1869339 RepID=UPI002D234D67|nr:BLUF domain-containing protein [Polaromonas sp.]HYW56133.1 BLUF domain-containing protein [Polaromonas sp.]
MFEHPQLHEVLYLSTLAPESNVKVVAQIAAQSRPANEAAGITGLLAFDGMRFCHHIEGPRHEVLGLVQRIRQDSRHTDMEVLHHGPLADRRFRRFNLGFCAVEDDDGLSRLKQSGPEEALAQFLAMLPSIDLDP